MSLGAHRSRLMAITKELALKWQETGNYWQDARRREFGQKYMDQLLFEVDKAVTVCEKLDRIITQARSDCE